MIVTIVEVYVKEEHLKDFIKATVENHRNSVKEPGNLRFDVLQNKNDPTRITLYEAYKSKEASLAHKETTHYLKWRDTVADWMIKTRVATPYKVIAPEEIELW